MQKLISKNPIQRFKYGEKIIKGQQSIPNGVYYETKMGNALIDSGRYFGGKKVSMPIALGSYYEKKDSDGNIIERGRWISGKQFPFSSEPIDGGNPLQKELVIVGRNRNKNKQKTDSKIEISFKNAFNKARNSGLQEFTWNDKRYNTMKAGESKEQWLSGLKGQQVPQLNQVAPITSIPTFATPKFDQQPVITNVSKPTYDFNRSQTRQLMRNAGYNPYDFTGAQRKALRLYLNGQSNDISQLEGIDLNKFKFKNGGRLIPRNPIKRFKLKNNI